MTCFNLCHLNVSYCIATLITSVFDTCAFCSQFFAVDVPINHFLDILQDIEVENLKPAVVKIYDYYQQSKYVPDIREREGLEEEKGAGVNEKMQTDILGHKSITSFCITKLLPNFV